MSHERLSERRSSTPGQRTRAASTAYNPHLGQRFAGNEYQPKYTHEDLDAFIDNFGENLFGQPFTQDGPLVVADSLVFDALYQIGLVAVIARVSISGTTATEIEVLVDGSVVTTVTIAAGEFRGLSGQMSVTIEAGGTLQMRTVTAGTGAQDLTVTAWMTSGGISGR